MIELHRKLLGDKTRNDAFAKALKQAIKPGKSVVADIGAGTGFLSFLARKYGAKECHLYEYSDVLELAQVIADQNGIGGLTFIKAHSTDAQDPPKADVVVCETLGNYALEENILETMNDAKRFLKSGGTMIPASISQCICPVSASRLHREVDVLDVGFNLDFSAGREVVLNNMYVRQIKPSDLLKQKDAIKQWDAIDFRKHNESVRAADLAWDIKKPATIEGFALWWEAILGKGITLSTSPMAKPTHWQQIYLPLLSPLRCKAGDRVTLMIESDSRYEVRINLAWGIRHERSGKVIDEQQLDMRSGQID